MGDVSESKPTEHHAEVNPEPISSVDTMFSGSSALARPSFWHRYKYFIIGGVVILVIAVVLAIVLPLTLNKSDNTAAATTLTSTLITTTLPSNITTNGTSESTASYSNESSLSPSTSSELTGSSNQPPTTISSSETTESHSATQTSSSTTTTSTTTTITTEPTSTPTVAEPTSTPNVTESTSIATVTESTSTPTITQSASTATVTESTSTATVTESASTATVTESTSTATVTESTSTPTITESASTATVTESTSTPTITESASTATVTESTSTVTVTESTSTPTVTGPTSTPTVTESTSTPTITESTSTPTVTESTSTATVTESTSTAIVTESTSTTTLSIPTTQPPILTETTFTNSLVDSATPWNEAYSNLTSPESIRLTAQYTQKINDSLSATLNDKVSSVTVSRLRKSQGSVVVRAVDVVKASVQVVVKAAENLTSDTLKAAMEASGFNISTPQEYMSDWWKRYAVYQVYPRSFYDSNADGTGDIQGIIEKLPYLRDIGIKAVWLSPVYKSPMKDFGYDISDFRAIDPLFGDMNDFDNLVAEMHDTGMYLILDYVPNHSSDQHMWFKESAAGTNDQYRDFYVWKDGKNCDASGCEPPNNWLSVFGNSSWEWVPARKQFYLHSFLKEQPDLNYRNPQVLQEMLDVFQFWLNKGVDGFRMDAVTFIVENVTFADNPRSFNPDTGPNEYGYLIPLYNENQPETYEVVRNFTDLMKSYGTRVRKNIFSVTEAYTQTVEEQMQYYTESGVSFTFNFNLLGISESSTATDVNGMIQRWFATMPEGDYWPNWVLGNHDQHRICSKLGGSEYADIANLLLLLLPGTPTCYYGDELGMTDLANMTYADTQDPQGCNAGPIKYVDASRDPQRTPMQWNDANLAGFTQGNSTWLPVNPNYLTINVESENRTTRSQLNTFRNLTDLRNNFYNPKAQKSIQSWVVGGHNDTLMFLRESANDTYAVVISLSKHQQPYRVNLIKNLYELGFYKAQVVVASLNNPDHNVDSFIPLIDVQLIGGSGVVLKLIKIEFIQESNRIDCHPDPYVNPQRCLQRGCIWNSTIANLHINAPLCYYPSSYGYVVEERINDSYMLSRESTSRSPFMASTNDYDRRLKFDVNYLDEHTVSLKFTDRDAKRFEVAEHLRPIDEVEKRMKRQKAEVSHTIRVEIAESDDFGTFSFKVIRNRTGTVLLDSSLGGLTFSDQFLQIGLKIPSNRLYGFGENTHQSLRHDLSTYKTWPLFSRDEHPDSTKEAKKNLYGVHPFFVVVEDDNHAFGVLLVNVNAQEYSTTPAPGVVLRTIGGVIELVLFEGFSPSEVINRYWEYIGTPLMPPYWALGFQLCRWGYKNLAEVEDVINRTRASGIPQDVQYFDIDYMDRYRDFTVDPINFAGMGDFMRAKQSEGLRFITMVDPAISVGSTDYQPAVTGVNQDVFVKWPHGYPIQDNNNKYPLTNGSDIMLAVVWPDDHVAFPDWFNPQTKLWWTEQLHRFHQQVPFDGLWLDMNEPSAFGTNQIGHTAIPSLQCPSGTYEDPPYATGNVYYYLPVDNEKPQRLSSRTICMSARHGNNSEDQHYDLHSLYGYMESFETKMALAQITKERGIVISRSTYVTSGSNAGGHWLGDNSATWADLRTSVIGMLEFNMFGIPYVGADICGFGGDTTEELCLRWMQLGAFYPMSRNHNIKGAKPQDPASMGAKVILASREALMLRYKMLPYLYTLFYRANEHNQMVVKPLFFEFPFTKSAGVENIDTQFMWGEAVMVVPVLYPNRTSVTTFFPKAHWYSLRPVDYGQYINGTNQYQPIEAPTTTLIPIFLRGGHVIPMQKPELNTQLSRKNPLQLLIGVDKSLKAASGHLYWDDGVSVGEVTQDKHDLFQFEYYHNDYTQVGTLIIYSTTNLEIPTLDTIEIFGFPFYIREVTVNEKAVSVDYLSYEPHTQYLRVHKANWIKLTSQHVMVVNFNRCQRSTEVIAEPNRVDCHPDPNPGVLDCSVRGCIWDYERNSTSAPQCYYRSSYGYVKWDVPTPPNTVYLNRDICSKSPFLADENDQEKKLSFSYQFGTDDENTVRLTIDETNSKRFHLNDVHEKMGQPKLGKNLKGLDSNTLEVQATYEKPFGTFSFKVIRKRTGTVLLDSSLGGLTFSDQFLQIGLKLPSNRLYGFGENIHQSLRHDMRSFKTWPLFSRDEKPWSVTEEKKNLYGVHPFFLVVEKDQKAFGVYFQNSNAQEYTTTPAPGVVLRTIGGTIDLLLFAGNNPDEVISRYWQYIGSPTIPPYWALGFQLCRWGYENLAEVADLVYKTAEAKIPQDVQYFDIDYMDRFKDFTIDHTNFDGIGEFVREKHSEGLRFITILDPAISVGSANYQAAAEGVNQDIFVKWPHDYPVPEMNQNYTLTNGTNILLSVVWPDAHVAFPDWFHPNATAWWTKQIVDFHDKVPFDGLWIDMNEPASFGTNQDHPCNDSTDKFLRYFDDQSLGKPLISTLKCPKSNIEDPPYGTQGIYYYLNNPSENPQRLSSRTICMSAVHGKFGEFGHYDVHSLYGAAETVHTQSAVVAATKERGMVISRSTTVGAGGYGGHWLGDNEATWDDMRTSIIGMLEFNMFGIPYVGADICGFGGNTTEELCLRWMQLGAFYPMSRNHNIRGTIAQDPVSMGPNVVKASQEALMLRYTLLPYLYTLFHRANKFNEMVVRPLFFDFPNSNETNHVFDDNNQFLWGKSVMIVPVLEKGMAYVNAYYPKGDWYHLRPFSYGTRVEGLDSHILTWANVDTLIPVMLRGGRIIPAQKPELNTMLSRKNPLELIIGVDQQAQFAIGDLYWDDGVSITTDDSYHLVFIYESTDLEGELTIQLAQNSTGHLPSLDRITIMGQRSQAFAVSIDGNLQESVAMKWDDKKQLQSYSKQKWIQMKRANEIKITFYYNACAYRWQTIEVNDRINCYPEPFAYSRHDCYKRNCVWDTDDVYPRCYYPSKFGFKVIDKPTNNSYTIATNDICSASPFRNPGEHPITNVTFSYQFIGHSAIRFNFKPNGQRSISMDPTNTESPLHGHVKPHRLGAVRDDSDSFSVEVAEGEVFSFKAKDIHNNHTLFDSSLGGLVISDQFIQISTSLKGTQLLMGYGENTHQSLFHSYFEPKIWPLFARDEGPWSKEETRKNLYGVHPFLLASNLHGKHFGILFLNLHAQELTVQSGSENQPVLIFRAIGGELDFTLITGDSPLEVVRQYWSIIGHPMHPPYWALGFQICRYGYANLSEVDDVVSRTRASGIPQDVQYFDIDYMDRFRDFTIDQDKFGGIPDYVRKKQTEGLRFISILDPAIDVNSDNYAAAREGIKRNIFVRWADNVTIPATNQLYNLTKDTDVMLAVVWPDHHVAFPDWLNNDTSEWWGEQIADFLHTVPLDGLWIDMNEPAAFGTNQEKPWYWSDTKQIESLKCPNDSSLEIPPYQTYSVYFYLNDEGQFPQRLSSKTICMTAAHGRDKQFRHYDVHNLYGFLESAATTTALEKATGKRPLVISRSTDISSGNIVGHWLGDNSATWADLRTSIIGMIEFNMFGVAYVGADICGFHGDTTEELCLRWMQLGAFYPFSRNHNDPDSILQDPASMGPKVIKASKQALGLRYKLLPYLYTLFYRANQFGEMVVRPPFFEFPNEERSFLQEHRFTWGSAVWISPVVEESIRSMTLWFPSDVDFYSLRDADYGEWLDVSTGDVEIATPLNQMIPIQIRGGYIVPTQKSALNTFESRKNPFGLIIAIDSITNSAKGDLYWDDGEFSFLNSIFEGDYWNRYRTFEFEFNIENSMERNATASLKIRMTNDGDLSPAMPPLELIEIFGLSFEPDFSKVTLDGNPVAFNLTAYEDTKRIALMQADNFIQMADKAEFTVVWPLKP